MLYEGLKFDFRVYVLLKSVAPLEIYIYKEGLVRFATEEYEEPSRDNLNNLCLHLTNYAVNKLNPKYEFNKTMSNLNYGHKKSLAEFFKSLQSEGCNSYRCWRQIKECIVKTIISVQPHLHAEYRKAQPKNQSESLCFQVLGFDFMMDKNSKVYLLEVNQSPSFST
jgi:tubulin polyglutamylase TTLL6/13